VIERSAGTSKNPNHQLIHNKYVHRMYLTPRRRYSVKITTSPNCNLCPRNTQGSFLHVFWEGPGVIRFWKEISVTLSDILKIKIPTSPALILLNDDSSLNLSMQHSMGWPHSSQEIVGPQVATTTFLRLAAVGQLISNQNQIKFYLYGTFNT